MKIIMMCVSKIIVMSFDAVIYHLIPFDSSQIQINHTIITVFILEFNDLTLH